jgi:hypothetical protein
MSNLINLGCKVAALHHRYDELHGTLFGASSIRLIIDALRGRREEVYRRGSGVLRELQEELAVLETEIGNTDTEQTAPGSERELREAMLDYLLALRAAMGALEGIYANLDRDEQAYRDAGADGRSRFTLDKLRYDHLLSELERQGTRLNKLFENY